MKSILHIQIQDLLMMCVIRMNIMVPSVDLIVTVSMSGQASSCEHKDPLMMYGATGTLPDILFIFNAICSLVIWRSFILIIGLIRRFMKLFSNYTLYNGV